MKKLIALLIAILPCSASFAQNDIPTHDTIVLKPEHLEGRWVEYVKNSTEKNIYIFRSDNSFHKASDSSDILLFDVAGKYTLNDDTIKILYQDFSRSQTKTKVRTMYLQVIALSDTELNISKVEDNSTKFIRLTKQNIK